MVEYGKSSHAIWDVKYHMVWITKYRYKVLRKRYWGQHLWSRGYFCASVGAVDEETIRKYIESQQWEDPGENFKITTPSEP